MGWDGERRDKVGVFFISHCAWRLKHTNLQERLSSLGSSQSQAAPVSSQLRGLFPRLHRQVGHSIAALISLVTWTKVYCCLLWKGTLYCCSRRGRRSSKTSTRGGKDRKQNLGHLWTEIHFPSSNSECQGCRSLHLARSFLPWQVLCRAGELQENSVFCVCRSLPHLSV